MMPCLCRLRDVTHLHRVSLRSGRFGDMEVTTSAKSNQQKNEESPAPRPRGQARIQPVYLARAHRDLANGLAFAYRFRRQRGLILVNIVVERGRNISLLGRKRLI